MTSSTKGSEPAADRVIVTGSSGFIGTHLCEALAGQPKRSGRVVGIDVAVPRTRSAVSFVQADIRDARQLAGLSIPPPEAVFHLAAMADSVAPFGAMGPMVEHNIDGTLNVLKNVGAKRVLFASSCAVYGHGEVAALDERWDHVNPVGAYGMTKAFGELACAAWALETGNAAIGFRFGNVVGKGCRGLIPYLVIHSLNDPEGATPARCRGGGRIVRDYVPAGYLVKVLLASLEMECASGSMTALNVASGLPRTNGEVAAQVERILRSKGRRLRIDWETPIAPGESNRVALDPSESERRTGVRRPSADEIGEAIEEAVLAVLQDGGTWYGNVRQEAPLGTEKTGNPQ